MKSKPLGNALTIKSVTLLGALAAAITVSGLLAAESPRSACRKAARAEYRMEAEKCSANSGAAEARSCIRVARREYRAAKTMCPAG